MNRTYDLEPELIERIDAAAGRLEVWQSDLVGYLLAHALGQVEAGALVIPVRPKGYAIDRSTG